MPIQLQMASASIQSKLESDLVKYLTSLRIREFKSEPHQVVLAMSKHMPEQNAVDSQEALALIGISYLFQVSKSQQITVISCSVTDSESEAQEQLRKFSQHKYQVFRDELGIHSHWIFLVPNQDINLNAREEFIDCFAHFEDDERPSCWITDVY